MKQHEIPCTLVLYKDGTTELLANELPHTSIDDPPYRLKIVAIDNGGDLPERGE